LTAFDSKFVITCSRRSGSPVISRGVVQQLHAGGIGHRLHVFNGLLHDIRQLHRVEGQRFAPALNAFQIENVVDQSHQPVGVGQGNAQQVRSLLVHLAEHSRRQQSQSPANRCQRRAQLMAHRGDELILHPVQSITLADVAKTQHPAGKTAVPTDGRQHILSRERAAIGAKEVFLAGRGGGSCRGLAQRAILAAGAVGRRGFVQQFVQWPARERVRRRAQQPPRRRVAKTHVALAVQPADAVGHRIQQDFLLPSQVVGAAAFLGSRQHLSQRCGRNFHCGNGVAVLEQTETRIKFQHREHLVGGAHRHCPP
jgi:hypothetical protein